MKKRFTVRRRRARADTDEGCNARPTGAGHPRSRIRALALSKAIAQRIAERDGRNGLSPREQDVLLMISKGLNNKEIGHVLFISQFTVRNHVKHILEKLGATDRTEAVSIALQHGFISMVT